MLQFCTRKTVANATLPPCTVDATRRQLRDKALLQAKQLAGHSWFDLLPQQELIHPKPGEECDVPGELHQTAGSLVVDPSWLFVANPFDEELERRFATLTSDEIRRQLNRIASDTALIHK